MFSLPNELFSMANVNLGLLHYESSMTISHPVEAAKLYVFPGRTTANERQTCDRH